MNVLVIKRGNELIVTPGLSERVTEGDMLIVVGRDSRIAELQTAAG